MPLFGGQQPPKPFQFHVDPALPFTSDFTAQEFWLCLDKGYRPLGLVVGNSVYSIGVIRGWLGGWKAQFRGDVQEFSQLLYDARKIALGRMQEEAQLLGADGMVGVELEIKELHQVLGTKGEYIEVVAVGTAVKFDPATPGRERGSAQVVLPVSDTPPVRVTTAPTP